MKYIHIQQHDEKDCGAACLSMISEYFGRYLPVSVSRELIKVDQYGANIYGIVSGAEEIGLTAIALKGDKNDFYESIVNGDIKFPFIARVLRDNAFEHFVVVYCLSNRGLKIADPAKNSVYICGLNEFLEIWLNNIITFSKNKSFKITKRPHILNKILKMFCISKKTFIAISMMSIIISVINICGALLFKAVLSDLHLTFLSFDKLCLALSIAFILQFIISIIRGNILAKASKKIDIDISMTYFEHLIDLPIEAFDKRNSGELLARFEDISIIREMISTVSVSVLLDILVAIISGIILYNISKVLFFILLIVVLFDVVALALLQPRIIEINHKSMINQSKVLLAFNECIKGAETIKSFIFEKVCKRSVNCIYKEYAETNRQSNININVLNCIIDFIESIGVIAIFYIGIRNIINGKLDIASLFSFYYISTFFISPAKALIKLQPLVRISEVALERLDDILDISIENNNGKELKCINDGIELNDISYAYGYRPNIIEKLDLFIPKSKKIAIIGECGGGKSTLAKIIVGMYKPQKGSIKIDGIDINEYSHSSIRKKIVYLPQQVFIKNDTLINNIAMGTDDYSSEKAEILIKKYKLDSILSRINLSYNYMLIEDGNNISGGQKQIISLIRAIVREPEIIIMDESMSSLDKEIEEAMNDIIYNIKGLTMVYITHKNIMYRNFDYIYQLKNGRVSLISKH